jgi:hypothetical protein
MSVPLRALVLAAVLCLGGTSLVEAEEASAGSDGSDAFSFGDDTSAYALNGSCEDPRFVGEDMPETDEAALMHDAKDCMSLFAAGDIDISEKERSIHVDGPLDMIEILTRVGKGSGKATELD